MYIFVTEDNNFFVSKDTPTADDRTAVDDGYLTIIKIQHDHPQYYQEGEWVDLQPLPEG